MPNEFDRETIQRLAYRLWEERGRPIGSPEVDWRRAEQELGLDRSSQGLPFSATALEPLEI